MTVYIISWIVLSLIIGAVGSSRKIGFLGAFFLSLLLSPLLGVIITIASKSNEAIKYEQELLKTQKEQKESLEEIKSQNVGSTITEELKKVKDLLDANLITQDEFEKIKNKILSNNDLVGNDVLSENQENEFDPNYELISDYEELNENEINSVKKLLLNINESQIIVINRLSRKIMKINKGEFLPNAKDWIVVNKFKKAVAQD